MNAETQPLSDDMPGMQEIVRTACVIESIQRRVPMEPGDLRVQETAAELILLIGEEVRASRQPN